MKKERMKRIAKIGALAAALALCLILTGCYTAPDDVNTNPTETGGFLPFPTMAPTATVTVTPDTIAVETQNIFDVPTIGIDTSAPTPTPAPDTTAGPGGWDGWGTVDGTTGTPLPDSIVFDTTSPSGPDSTIAVVTEIPATPTPTVAPVTPSPTPKSLQIGFKDSEEVKKLQKRLKELGYYKGSVDGDYGPATEKAVKEFQKANGLTADGKAGSRTQEKLYSSSAVTYKQAHATATPKPKKTNTPKPKATATPKPKSTSTPDLSKDYYLQSGSKGRKVETLQRRLIELGWLSGGVTGTYDDATEAAVLAFQKKTSGLWADGIAGPDTLRALYSSNAARGNNSGSSGSTTKADTLELGSTGSEVRKLQQALKDLGYLSGSVDGSFGVATQAAVIAFQKNNNLTADGKAGTATQSKLYSGTARRSSGTAASIGGTDSSGRDTSDIGSTGYITLEVEASGEQVRRLQQRLKDLGYYSGTVDGKYGDATQAAVMAFQLRNNLTVDGKAGPATQRLLYGSSSNISYPTMEQGMEGNSVRNLQYTLYELGYYDGNIDGIYGQTTADAVRAFQIQNGLTPVDGKAGSKTLSKLYSADALAATAQNLDYGTAELGMTGDLVVQIQDLLVEYGFLQKISGVYDEATEEAVKAFQLANGLDPDGKCGKLTLQVLFGY